MSLKKRCPQCGSQIEKMGSYAPFCSERCQLLDLGAWASEKYTIAGKAEEDRQEEATSGESSDR